MKNVRKTRGLAMASMTMVLGCGGRSATLGDYPDELEPGGEGGWTSTSAGGTTTNPGSGGIPSWGGWVASGGYGYGGFSTYPINSYECCITHSGPGCYSFGMVKCVCDQYPSCCTNDWNWTCVNAINLYGCGYCATGSGGVPAWGGATGKGGTTTFGGTKATGGTISRGGSGGSGGWGGTVAKGGTTSMGGTKATGGTNVFAGGSSAGGSTAKEACCSAHPSTGCNDAVIEKCVCGRDAVCCNVGWDSTCVLQVNSFGCGSCGAGGTSGSGGAPFSSGGSKATGGSTGMGGTIAQGGSPPAGGVVATGGASATGGAPQNMIDDLEDGDGDIIVAESRGGYWYTFNDSTTTGWQSPVWGGRIFKAQPISDRPGSLFAAWTQGSGFTSWGAGMALYFRGASSLYNANKYRGISFWAKIGLNAANVVRMNVSDNQTVSDGGFCTECWDHFGVTFVAYQTWQRYSYLWSDMTQRGWGAPLATAINPAKVRGIEFSTQEGIDFELYIDDIAFIP